MALADNDLLIIQRPSTKVHYKIKVADLPSGDTLPNGTEAGQHLMWNGLSWVPASEVDGGTY